MRPVSRRTRSNACSGRSSTTSKCVTASRGVSVSSDCRVGSERSRPIAASIRPALDRGRPRTSARYSRSSRWRRTSPRSRLYASSVLATTSRPDVCRSSRCTMPGRSGLTARPSCPRSACTSVPPEWPAPGCTTRPAGLSTTRRCSSSKAIRRSSGCATSGSATGRLELDLLPLPQPVGLLPRDPVDAHLAGREQPLGRGPRADLVERREEPVEANPRRRRRDADADQERGALLSERSSDPRRTATPTTIDASARLKAGHQRRSRKSVT